MKLLFCQECGDIIAPHPIDGQPRWCRCKRHAVWWIDGARGTLRLWDALEGPYCSVDAEGKEKPLWYPNRPRAYVIGLTNALLNCEWQGLGAEIVQKLIDSHSDYYLFKRWRSLVIRIRPGESGDTAWSRLPPNITPEAGWSELTKVLNVATKWAKRDGSATDDDLLAAVSGLNVELDKIDAAETEHKM